MSARPLRNSKLLGKNAKVGGCASGPAQRAARTPGTLVVDGVGLGLGLGLSETGLGLFQLGLGLFYIGLGLFHLGLFS